MKAIKQGYTIVELLVVVAIIIILFSIFFPRYFKSREAAKLAGCEQNEKTLAAALEVYKNDNSSQFVPNPDGGNPGSYPALMIPKWVPRAVSCPNDPKNQPYGYQVDTLNAGKAYTITCKGSHTQAGSTALAPPLGYPIWTSSGGLRTR